ncbi:MAG: hypothetical protein Q7L55_01765 [Actinomycetota bacterium]|nr:hypothetical protein [Actinomycetota bacterium]
MRAIACYERLGFLSIGMQVFGDDRCLVHQLTRERWHLFRSSGLSDTSLTQ